MTRNLIDNQFEAFFAVMLKWNVLIGDAFEKKEIVRTDENGEGIDILVKNKILIPGGDNTYILSNPIHALIEMRFPNMRTNVFEIDTGDPFIKLHNRLSDIKDLESESETFQKNVVQIIRSLVDAGQKIDAFIQDSYELSWDKYGFKSLEEEKYTADYFMKRLERIHNFLDGSGRAGFRTIISGHEKFIDIQRAYLFHIVYNENRWAESFKEIHTLIERYRHRIRKRIIIAENVRVVSEFVNKTKNWGMMIDEISPEKVNDLPYANLVEFSPFPHRPNVSEKSHEETVREIGQKIKWPPAVPNKKPTLINLPYQETLMRQVTYSDLGKEYRLRSEMQRCLNELSREDAPQSVIEWKKKNGINEVSNDVWAFCLLDLAQKLYRKTAKIIPQRIPHPMPLSNMFFLTDLLIGKK